MNCSKAVHFTNKGDVFCFFWNRCYYARQGFTSAKAMNISRKKIRGQASDKGEFSLDLGVFKDKDFTDPYGDQDFPIGVSVSTRIFMQLSVSSSDKRLSILAERCHATPDTNPNNSLQYDLIRDG